MIGIISHGAYIPRLRIERMSIYQAMGWYIPATVMVAQGERSFCNWDEDSLTMAVAASRDCLTGMDRKSVDGLYLCSTTMPFADRQNATVVKTALNLRDDVATHDFAATQRAGTSAMVNALEALRGGQRRRILVTASDRRETPAGGFYEMWFGDGAASVLLGEGDDKVIAEFLGSESISLDFVDHYRGSRNKFDYTWEERWVRDEGYAKIIPEAVERLMAKLSISIDDVDKLVFPCFFKAERRNIAKKLGASADQVTDGLHEACGECGTAHPLVMLSEALQDAAPGDRILLVGFGQGADALYFKATDKIADLPERMGAKGSLKRKKSVDNYAKFLIFRDLIEAETGIRAEAPTQTAMSVTWRQRKMLTGMVGGKCTKCGTPQFPKMDICVNPDCQAHHSQEDYAFSEQRAKVKTYTGDYLAVSLDPPAIYGMVQFDNGGRFLADYTDCELDDVWVGQPVELSFRKRYTDEARGFSGYFWKAVPLPGEKPPEKPKDEIRFDGKVAVVTGAGGGLGRVYALELAQRGAKVVVNDLGGAPDGSGKGSAAADKVVSEIEAAGGEAVANYDSVASVEGGQNMINQAVETFGGVHIVINNAGILRDRSLLKLDPQDWDAVLQVHLNGAYNVTRPAMIKMREQGYGRIIMTTSAAGLFGNFGQTNYGAAKLGIMGLMNTLKLEGQKYDIKVNTVAPIALTRLTEGLLPPDMEEKMKPEYISPLVLYLASDNCEETGMIFNAGMGYFSRAAMVAGPVCQPASGDKIPTAEDVMKNFEAVNDLSRKTEYENATAALMDMMEGPGADEEGEEAGGAERSGGPTVADVFDQMADHFLPDKAEGVNVIFQYNITGAGGGEWYVDIRDKTCTVTEGAHDSPTTVITMSAEDFLALIAGKLNAMKAYTSGKLKIGGDLMKSQLIEKVFKFR